MIKLNKIKKVYENGSIRVEALKEVDLHIKKGEFTSIIGKSGSGKSTLMNILGCLDQPTDGEYLLDGINVSKMNEKELARIRNKMIGFVFQSFNLLPKFSALENVELPMIYKGVHAKERYKKAVLALEKVGLGDRINHKPNEMSGGQKQRVAIARALVNDPKLIFADEPTGNLDSKSEKEIIDIFRELNREGVTIVMVTHEESIANRSQRIVEFRDGMIVEDREQGIENREERIENRE
ncbi:MAG: macrolide ABC transporter ATP-binding protein [Fusobacteriia bacterium 4572_132]|nr:MAG: macrolide ABC transporter ATP-binding protein [Fusobacteriia bacterium 4572_132]